jgi:PAS domain S-box-containing protein
MVNYWHLKEMPTLYLTPASIGYITQLILSLAITIYLAGRLRKQENRSPQTILLTAIFAVSTLFVGLLFLDAASLPAPRLQIVYLENTVLGVMLVLLLQFAYRFPAYFPKRKWEAYGLLAASLLYTLYEALFALYRFSLLLRQGRVEYRPPEADYALAALFIWVPIVFLRQAITADERSVSWLRKLWQPQGLGARGARTFALVFILLFALSIVAILEGFSSITTTLYSAVLSFGILVAIWWFATAYLNFLPENTSFLVKLSGMTLTLLLAVLGLVGWSVSSAYITTFQPALVDHQTLRFTPNASGGYDVSPLAFHYETNLGDRLPDNPTRNWPVSFPFLFYGKTYSDIYITNIGALSLGQSLHKPDLQNNSQSFPGIFPLLVNLDINSDGGVFARVEPDRLIVTWDHLPVIDFPEAIYTFQAVLYRNGRFDVTYNGLPSPLVFTPDAQPYSNPWLRGMSPGLAEPVTQVADLSQSGSGNAQGVVQDFYLAFRQHLHHLIAPLAWLIIASSLLIIFGLPILVKANLVKPLNALLAGIERLEGGDLTVDMPIQYRDEIGSLTASFNSMAAQLRLYVTDLEQRVKGRTQELQIANTQLHEEAHERKQAEEALRQSEVRYRTVSQSASDAIISANHEGKIVGWNRSAELIFGYSEAEVMERPLTLLMPARFHEPHSAGMNRVQRGGEKHLIGKTVEVQGQRKDGSEFPLEMSLSEWEIEDGRFYTAIIRDITERKLADEALRQSQIQIIQQQRDLATAEEREQMSRDLHDSIGQVIGYVNVQAQAAQELLKENQLAALQENLRQLVGVAQDAHVGLRHTILGLRDAAVPQRNFYQTLQAYLNAFHQAWGLETLFSTPREELPVLPAAVEDQLLHIVQEALVNIRKHAGARRVEVFITLQSGEMTLSIRDDGRGFDLQLAPGTKEEHFGLSIMRERVEQVGGRLEIRSFLGHGTQLFVYIPIPSTASTENPKDVYSLRILLVDDQPLFLEGMQNLLKARGLTVIGTAHDGLEAIEQVKALRPDVVLMDVQMPKCDGIEATRRIKAEFPATKVVLLTVSEEDEHLLDAIKFGASSYLLKNLDASQLFATLDGLGRGEIQLAPALASRLVAELNRAGTSSQTATSQDEPIPAELTLRQWEVLRLVARGLTYKEVGGELHLTEQAIKYHMGQILERLQVKNREQAVAYLRQVQAERRQQRS